MVLADQRDYKNGYNKHYIAYCSLKRNNDSIRSRCLLLVYSVECGLKYRLLDEWRIYSPKDIIKDKQDYRGEIITSHNIQKMLVELKQPQFRFPQIVTKHGDYINSENYHQFCRYGIKSEDYEKVELYERVLLDIIEWIRRGI